MPADPNRVNWDECALERITEMVSRRVSIDRRTGTVCVQSHLRKGALVPQHTHPGAQRIQVLAGALAVRVDGVTSTLGVGDTITIAPGVRHELEALDDSIVVDARDGDVEF
jgi:quercetin dioxygenase-like cupin family protein